MNRTNRLIKSTSRLSFDALGIWLNLKCHQADRGVPELEPQLKGTIGIAPIERVRHTLSYH